ncbi:MAG TPA: DUF3014 domain-containing protein [Thermoanaerobaculia bacterium]|nr:DUF3014 domain-containing protein [Thermoanaerobaculia bacterium]
MNEPRLDSWNDGAPPPAPPERPSSPGAVIAIAVVLALGIGAGAWYWLGRDRPEPAPAVGAPAPEPAPSAAAPAAPALELPPLNASDALLREVAGRLSAHPRWIAWLAHENLARRFVASVINVAEGVSPAGQLRFLTPAEPFRVRGSGGRTVIDAASYHRFDTLTEVFDSLDEPGVAELYRQLHPLFDEAYREVGDPERDFDQTLALAIGNLLRVQVPDRPIEVVAGGASWQLADRDLESWNTAEKHLLRLGPDNARRVQAKLRALAGAIGVRPI